MRSVHLQMGAKRMSSLGVILNSRENNTASDVREPLPSFPGYVKGKKLNFCMLIMILSPYSETTLKAACQPARDGETAALAPMGKYPGAECTRITGGGRYYVCGPQDLPQRVFSKSLTNVASKLAGLSTRPFTYPPQFCMVYYLALNARAL